MNYWLVKTEPETYSWTDLAKNKTTVWDGIRNFQARSNLKKMQHGDLVFIYHTGDEKSIAGIAVVSKEAFPETKDPAWTAIELEAKKPLKNPVSLAQIKSDKRLSDMVLVKAPRLSVQAVKKEEFDLIVALGEGK